MLGKPQSLGSKVKGFLIDFTAGGITAAISKTLIAPIERVKLLLQTQDVNTKLKIKYKGIGDCFGRVIKEEGPLTLWRGNGANVVRYFPTQAFNFAFKEKFKIIFIGDTDKNTQKFKYAIGSILAGGVGSSCSLSIVYPLDYARTRLSTDIGASAKDRMYNGLGDCLKKSIAADGWQSVYRGFCISIAGIFVYRGCYFGFYDIGKANVTDKLDIQNPFLNRAAKFAMGFATTTAAGICSYPFDTVRRRMQMDVGKKKRVYKGSLDCFHKIMKSEGREGFFKGCLSNVFRGIGATLVLVVYDDVQNALRGTLEAVFGKVDDGEDQD